MEKEAFSNLVDAAFSGWFHPGQEAMAIDALNKMKERAGEDNGKPVIYIGTATCGRIAGAMKTREAIESYLYKRQIAATITEVGCLGICSSEPLVDIRLPGRNRISFEHVTASTVGSLLDDVLNKVLPADQVLGQYREEGLEAWREAPYLDQHPFFKKQQRLILKHAGIINPSSLEEYVVTGGYGAYLKILSRHTPLEVCDMVEQSRLRGRAGAGFPTGTKWKTVLQAQAVSKYVICNAQESDPGAFLDRNLLESNPHAMLEGLLIACYGVGSNRGIIYVRAAYRRAIELVLHAIEQAKSHGLLGHNIMQSGFSLEIELQQGPGAFVCGEETALIANLEGRRGMPQNKPPYPSESGLYRKPTLINNVESLCNIPAIIANGPEWFCSIGTDTSKGTKIFALSGQSLHSGMIEVPMGTKLEEVVFDIAGGIPGDKACKAIQLGGPNGWCLPLRLLESRVDYEELKGIGAGMGSGGMVVYDESVCMVDMAAFFMDFMQKQSCGKCIPCREGTKRMREILEGISKRPMDHNGHATLERFKGVMQLEAIGEVMKDTSLCGLGVHAPNPVLSAVTWFREEFEEHIFNRHCQSGVCRELRSYRIDVDHCTGCGLCGKRCPENAIIGTELKPFFIVEERCNGCGICNDVCKFGAVIMK